MPRDDQLEGKNQMTLLQASKSPAPPSTGSENGTGTGSDFLVEFYVLGIPRPQGSKSLLGNGRMVEASLYVGDWRNAVMAAAHRAYRGPAITEAVELDVTFFFPRPKSHYGTGANSDTLKPSKIDLKPAIRPDLSKLVRSTEDAMAECSGYPVMRDDGQVTDLTCRKRYADEENPPGALVRLRIV